MTHYETVLTTLRRPRTLIRAARHGATRYRRDRDLKFLPNTPKPKSSTAILDNLLDFENTLEATRKAGAADYNVTRHVSVLTALIAEVRAAAHVSAAQ